MFGVLRTALALMVMAFHLFVGILPLGTYAVFGFYIVSGYLMTLVMHESYGFTWRGRYSFVVNRFLRLYPQYWVAALFSMILIFALGGDTVIKYHGGMFLPVSFKEIAQNILMVFPAWMPGSINPRLVPPTWAITVELFFYILICLGVSKTFGRVKIWVFMSVCYVICSFIVGASWENRYFPIAAASLPFSIGGGIYFASISNRASHFYSKIRLSSLDLFVLMLVNCIVWVVFSKFNIKMLVELGFYINIIICALLVYSLAVGGEIFRVGKKVDKIVGDCSFPIYLLHWQSGILVSYLIFGEAFHEFSQRGFVSFVVSLIIVIVISLSFVFIIDKPIQSVRIKIKANPALKRSYIKVPRA